MVRVVYSHPVEIINNKIIPMANYPQIAIVPISYNIMNATVSNVFWAYDEFGASVIPSWLHGQWGSTVVPTIMNSGSLVYWLRINGTILPNATQTIYIIYDDPSLSVWDGTVTGVSWYKQYNNFATMFSQLFSAFNLPTVWTGTISSWIINLFPTVKL
jgi:hypothetical protein